VVDTEVNIFLKKTKQNPLKWVLFIVFGYKIFLDVFKKKFVRKSIPKFILPGINELEVIDFKLLEFVNIYNPIYNKTYFHFENATETDKVDCQFENYRHRFYYLPFINENELENANLDLNSWVVNNPIENKVAWHPYNVSERIVNWSIFLTRFSKKNSVVNQQILTKEIYKNACFLYHNFELHLGIHNHLINNSRALLYAAALFRNVESTIKWKSHAYSVLENQLNYQFLEDGAHSEQSTSYHLLMTRTIWELTELSNILGEKLNLNVPFSKLVKYAFSLIGPNESFPLIGHVTPDIHWKELVGLLPLWVEDSTIKKSSYCLLFNSSLEKLKFNNENNCVEIYAKNGIGVLHKNDIKIFISNDPRCEILNHGDHSQLGLDICWGKFKIIRDCGLVSYNLDDKRNWYESWQGQSTFVLNKVNPIVIEWRRRQLPRKYYNSTSEISKTSNFSIKASHNCYARIVSNNLVSREVKIENNKILIEDKVVNSKGMEYNSIFHFGDFNVSHEGGTIILKKEENVFLFKILNDNDYFTHNYYYAEAYGVEQLGTSLEISCNTQKGNESFKYSIEKLI
jgi:hypothetical protein